MEPKEVVTRTSVVRMESHGLVRITSLPGVVHTLEDAKATGAVVKNLIQDRKVGLLVDIRRLKLQDREAREYYTKLENTMGFVAIAILAGSPMSRVIGNLYIGFNKSAIPTRLFTTEADARTWLETFPCS